MILEPSTFPQEQSGWQSTAEAGSPVMARPAGEDERRLLGWRVQDPEAASRVSTEEVAEPSEVRPPRLWSTSPRFIRRWSYLGVFMDWERT